jgi:hypothetical protein
MGTPFVNVIVGAKNYRAVLVLKFLEIPGTTFLSAATVYAFCKELLRPGFFYNVDGVR